MKSKVKIIKNGYINKKPSIKSGKYIGFKCKKILKNSKNLKLIKMIDLYKYSKKNVTDFSQKEV